MLTLRLTLLLYVLGSVPCAALLTDGVSLRLSDGGHSCSGRVEVYYNNQWGTVCDDSWDMKDAEVVCRQLGCENAVRVHQRAHFGQGSGPIWLDDIWCSGSEGGITQCFHNGFGLQDCDHAEDAGVTCIVDVQQPNISFSDADGWFSWGSGRLEVIRGYGFSIICSTEPQYPGGSFHLKFSGSNITRTQSDFNQSAVFLFPEADFVHQGSYSCIYEVNVSSRTITSSSSDPLFITVKAPLAPYIGVGVTAVLLLFLVPVVIYFVRTQKRGTSQIDKKKEMQFELCAKDTHGSPQGKTEADDVAIYGNIGTIFQQNNSDDAHNDYVDVDGAEQSQMDNDYEDIYANECIVDN